MFKAWVSGEIKVLFIMKRVIDSGGAEIVGVPCCRAE
jgi:hypothetical protein